MGVIGFLHLFFILIGVLPSSDTFEKVIKFIITILYDFFFLHFTSLVTFITTNLGCHIKSRLHEATVVQYVFTPQIQLGVIALVVQCNVKNKMDIGQQNVYLEKKATIYMKK